MNLRVLSTFSNRYPGVVLGLSDHSVGTTSILGAIALGARVVERHFTDDVSREGPDHPFSTDAKSWWNMIKLARELEEMLGDGIKRVEKNEEEARIVQRRSICAKKDLQEGHILCREDLDYLRPCTKNALTPSEIKTLIGKRLVMDMEKGQSFSMTMFSDQHKEY
jgi:N-acetylneuraminate synthase